MPSSSSGAKQTFSSSSPPNVRRFSSSIPNLRAPSENSRPSYHTINIPMSESSSSYSAAAHQTFNSPCSEASTSSASAARVPLDASTPTSRYSNVSQPSSPFFSGASSSSSTQSASSRASRSSLKKLFGLSRSGKGSYPSHPQSEARTSKNMTENECKVVAIKVLDSSNVEGKVFDPNKLPHLEMKIFNPNKLLTGDIVESVTIDSIPPFRSTFTNGKKGLFGVLQLHSGCKKLVIHVKRQGREIRSEAKLGKIKNSMQDFQDESHQFTFEDYYPQKCQYLQEEERKREAGQVQGMKVAAVTVDYLIGELQTNTLHSMVVAPQQNVDSSPQFHDVDKTVLKAISWFNASTTSGVPLVFHNIQTEPFVLERESSTDTLSSIANSGAYAMQQSLGAASLDVVRAIRVWFQFEFNEVEVKLKAREGEQLFGVTIGRTTEGFCHVTDVVEGSAAARAELKAKLKNASDRRKKLVVTRVGKEKVLPWFISESGKIRCSDVTSIITILQAYRHTGQPASLHILDIESDPAMANLPEDS